MWPGQKLIFFASIKSDSNSYCIFCPLGTEQRYRKQTRSTVSCLEQAAGARPKATKSFVTDGIHAHTLQLIHVCFHPRYNHVGECAFRSAPSRVERLAVPQRQPLFVAAPVSARPDNQGSATGKQNRRGGRKEWWGSGRGRRGR